ncbi:UDP-N-acetylmuramate dehydrogenase [Geofilum sp. OHC36d9]|uniref:UDP-N-acetylmuramate dehydrogenase n=1 Tax=Geofilum sp. OHC36d9 TaxID=3458413 RepID=UPI004033913D
MIEKNYSLRQLNTFGLDVKTDFYVKYGSVEELKRFLRSQQKPDCEILVLGGGSNLLFAGDFKGLIIHSATKGVEVVSETDNEVIVRSAAGETWDDLVAWTVAKGFYGLENLSYIPGQVGASAVQNIGAYGVEVKDVFEKATGVWLQTGGDFEISKDEIGFDYRYSVFKGPLKGQVVLTDVYFRLNKNGSLNFEYGALSKAVESLGGATLETIRQAVIQIRKSKLPDPETVGNAGSFFKNPVVSGDVFNSLVALYPNIPYYRLPDHKLVKIPAGWLIEQCGWKGKSMGQAAVHQNQALVIINRGGAVGNDIIALAETIQNDVKSRFGIDLEMEVNIV